ncbi:MAG: aminotransferase class I/II-fold pyridoxal phosphate-dependent enzyme [Fimbriimonadia bacterium]|jgi:histidinol-phosphate aminotransferase
MSVLKPAPALAHVTAYAVPMHPAPIDLRLDGNEGMRPPAELLSALTEAGPEVMKRYPDASELQGLLAERLGVEPTRVLVTAGADDALDRACRAMLAPGRQMLLPSPTFEMLPRYASLAGAKVVTVAWPPGKSFPIEAALLALTQATSLVCFVSPNNPTGAAARAEDLRRLSEAAPHALILADFAYAEFADRDDTQFALSLPNVVVARTLSKAWGLAGLRVGYAVGPPEVIAWMRAAGSPYSVSRASLLLASEALRRGDEGMRAFVERVRFERGELQRLLVSHGVESFPSQANFVLARHTDALWLRDAMAGMGIAIRAFPGRESLADCVRITCPGDEEQFDRVCKSLSVVFAPQALLLDLDGVLADISGSYRRAVFETAKSFGVTLDPQEVVRAKAAGQANNDYELTHRLLSDRDVSVSLTEVIERYEALYAGEQGLWRNERLLVDADWLRSLAARIPLGIVTGRLRRHAERFLSGVGLLGCLGALVCMEDAPEKPSPEPLLLAMNRLGVQRAWMVGDLVDDVSAARAAGVLPLAVVSPADTPEVMAPALLRAGAARVLTRLEEVERLLP